MPAVSFDKLNRELRTVRFYFRNKQESVLKIHWAAGISRGTTIEAGDLLAKIEWRKSGFEDIRAPRGCAGTVERTNRNITAIKLKKESFRLLYLA